MITQGEITGAAHPPRDTWIATATGSIPALLSSRPIHTCVFHFENTRWFFLCDCLDTCALSSINVGLNITAMTGKLADKIPLTMSSLINTIPDSLYPEEDIPTSMNIFTSTESINHYSQMNTGKIFIYFCVCVSVFNESVSKCDVRERQQLSPGLEHLFALRLLRVKAHSRSLHSGVTLFIVH